MSGFWKCPGQDSMFWRPGDIFEEPCPFCGQPIEFWKDDIRVKCPHCGQIVTNPRFSPGCAAWCSYAANCLGEEAYQIQHEPSVMRDRLKIEVAKELKDQRERLNRALKAASLAEKLVKEEGAADMIVSVAASLLHVLLSHNPRAVEDVMERVDLEERVRQEIRAVLAGLDSAVLTGPEGAVPAGPDDAVPAALEGAVPAGPDDKTRPLKPAEAANPNLRVTADAVRLAEWAELQRHGAASEQDSSLPPTLFTSTARRLASEMA